MKGQLYFHKVKANSSKIQSLLRKGDPTSKSDASALIQEQQELEPSVPDCTRFIANDTTVEKLAELLKENPSILVCRDELQGFFASLERHGQESARAFYLEAWTGTEAFKVDRISRGSIRIPRVCVSVLGGIQPGPMGCMMRELQRNAKANDGLLQRFQLAVWPDLSRRFELVDIEPNRENWRNLTSKFERMGTIESADVGAGTQESYVLHPRCQDDT